MTTNAATSIEAPAPAEATEIGVDAEGAADLLELRRGMLDSALKLGQGVDRNQSPYHWMLDCRELLLSSPALRQAGRLLWRRVKAYRPDFVGGMTLAANPLTIALLYESAADGRPVSGFLIRREPKADGLRKRVEGPALWPGARVVLLDDIVNSGQTQTQALEALEPFRPSVVAVAALVDCQRSGSRLLESAGIPLHALFTLGDLGLTIAPPARPGALKVRWKVGPINRNRNNVPKSAACVYRGAIYVGADAGFLASLALDGRERWTYAVRDETRGIHSSPAAWNGKIYFGAYDGYLYCLDETGKLIWEARLGQWIGSSPAVIDDPAAVDRPIVVVGVEHGEAGGDLVALDAETGSTRWRFEASGYMHGSPAYDAPRRQIIVGANDCTLYAVDLAGAERWRFIAGGELKARPTLDEQGRCYVGSFDGSLYALDASNGALLWRRRVGSCAYFTPLALDDLIIVGGHSCRLVALERNGGRVRWVATAGGRIMGGATAAGPGRLAFGAADGVLSLLDAADGKTVDSYRTGGEILTTPAYGDGLLLVSSMDGELYAFDAVG